MDPIALKIQSLLPNPTFDSLTANLFAQGKYQFNSQKMDSKINWNANEKLIVFIKAPRPGTVKTRLARTIGAESACAAYRRIVATLLARLHSLGVTVVDSAPGRLSGDLADTYLRLKATGRL